MTTPLRSPPQVLINRTAAAVAVLVVLILGGALGALMRFDVPQPNHDILLVVVTAVATNVTSIVSYFFGSSSSTKTKDDTIAAQASTIATTVPPASGSPTIPLAAGEAVNVKAEEAKP